MNSAAKGKRRHLTESTIGENMFRSSGQELFSYERAWKTAAAKLREVCGRRGLRYIPVRDTDCWEWTGRITKTGGYGQIVVGRFNFLVHRLAFRIWKGRIPEGHEVMHDCDNRLCWNPAHLFPGTHQENMMDMVRKGRNRPGGRESDAHLLQRRWGYPPQPRAFRWRPL